jgi:hypothetical protein
MSATTRRACSGKLQWYKHANGVFVLKGHKKEHADGVNCDKQLQSIHETSEHNSMDSLQKNQEAVLSLLAELQLCRSCSTTHSDHQPAVISRPPLQSEVKIQLDRSRGGAY